MTFNEHGCVPMQHKFRIIEDKDGKVWRVCLWCPEEELVAHMVQLPYTYNEYVDIKGK